jgi:hypothetical protein
MFCAKSAPLKKNLCRVAAQGSVIFADNPICKPVQIRDKYLSNDFDEGQNIFSPLFYFSSAILKGWVTR